ncbi:cell division cycle-associated protein 3 [Hippocampus zosterae]|uniref:cell division cycle-associated protein 3 n=1 Tax=Hippocampus zosterae TaxID=109293 RepID=UPI00223CE74C|nr:cell division cycle-associated protein 3 [Hippocampus zosterae]XP_051921202.1 cell division cycle-associated protein 3 [Hippocampus zosterae]
MGANESKITESAADKPQAPVKNSRVAQLNDPRSPSVAIDRTPIQVGGNKMNDVTNECPLERDPRSPTVGIARTPVREVMRAKVGSFARRLGMLLHVEAEGKLPPSGGPAQENRDALKSEELGSTEPLLTPQRPRLFGALAEHVNFLDVPVQSEDGSCSPFVLLEEPQVEVDIETDGASLEEAEEARESPLHKRLSMSLITCHEGAPASQILAEVHRDGSGVAAVTASLNGGADHLRGLPDVTPEPTLVSSDPPVQLQEDAKEVPKEASRAPGSQLPTGAHRLTLDIRSPSQVVFKPQWLGKGFGATGLRARAVQGSKGGASPLAVSVVVKNVNDENKGNSGKQKQKDGRSPLQILNSHRVQPQMKLKTSTPEKPRPVQLDRRLLAASLNNENR